MLDRVGSTSWHNRHLACFQALDKILLREAVSEPTVMIIGPGGVTRLASRFLNDSMAHRRSRVRKLIGDIARYGDQLLRRIPVMPLESLEPMEIRRTLSMSHSLVVVDRSRRVLAAVAKQLPDADCHCVDISVDALPVAADIVIAFNVICRLEDPVMGMKHVAAAVRDGGWLMIDDRSAASHLVPYRAFENVSAKIHRKSSSRIQV